MANHMHEGELVSDDGELVVIGTIDGLVSLSPLSVTREGIARDQPNGETFVVFV